jgi:GT2 family glycosyltransferase
VKQVGLVAIGRNEGQRLHQCLVSALGNVDLIVYVDSGSTDNSVELARSLGVEVVNLDLTFPFTAARARNAGLARLLALCPDIEFVQFVDGDCEIVSGWLDRVQQTLVTQPELAVVCGRRRERFPQLTIYNQLCDLEWDTPIGEAKACGGDAMMRIKALQQVGGFNPTLIAGEEPELCVRLRQQGWKVLRLDAEMTLHDAQMTQFSQWWQRTVRAGYAYAEGAWLHGQAPERHWVRESRSIWFWGLGLPLIAIGLAWVTQGFSLALFAAYPLLILRIFIRQRRRNVNWYFAIFYAFACVFGKFALFQGTLTFFWRRLCRSQVSLIEYKH